MSRLHGRNEIPLNNSDGRCLLENWVEERAVAEIDPQDLNGEKTSGAKLFKDGHKGLLTSDFDSKVDTLTTVQDSYRPPQRPNVRQRGAKEELLEQMLYEQLSKEVEEEFSKPPEPLDYRSITQKDFNIVGFEPTEVEPTAHHDYVSEQPVSFWTEHKEKIHGTSQIKTFDSPFRKNAAFSKQIDEYWDEPQPFDSENVPKM